ncbi:MAG: hypothetical protein LBI61_04240 [Puniceicoccales bacterium]|jgi:hypothetical protein|nr:hypothetical protein [Puniceicoccales bacterium]
MNLEGYFSQDESDEGYFLSLSERGWHSYLDAVDSEAGKFFRLFIESRSISNHLDMIFAEMKWKKVIFDGCDCPNEDGVEVVTFHKNPVLIASKAIFFFIERIWDVLVAEEKGLSAGTCWRFAKIIASMREEMLSGIASVDSCEYILGICHFKNVVAAVNDVLSSMWKLPKPGAKVNGFTNDFTVSLFDIRELAWQSIVMCNISEKRYNEGS